MTSEEGVADLIRALARRDRTAKAAEKAREDLYDVIRRVSPHVRQVDIMRITGWSRQHIRDIVNGKGPKAEDQSP